jgi:hypothetical protein
VYEALAEKFKNDRGVVIAKMDGTANDQSSVTVDRYPTIYLFANGMKVLAPYLACAAFASLSFDLWRMRRMNQPCMKEIEPWKTWKRSCTRTLCAYTLSLFSLMPILTNHHPYTSIHQQPGP